MKDHNIERLIEALETLLRDHLGIASLDEVGPVLERLANHILQLKQYCNRAGLTELLRNQEMRAEDEIFILASAESFPALAIALFREAWPLVMREFPEAMSPGRPNVLTIEQKRAVCKFVAELHGEGIELKAAKQQAAARFNVSMSTISRAWAERKDGHKPSVKEIVKMLTAGPKKNIKVATPDELTKGKKRTRKLLKGGQD